MNKRNLNIDLIKILACFFVVALHTQRNYQLELIHNPILYYISRCAVPLFLMVNGYLLLKKEEIDYKYVLHKTKKILFVIVFWTLAYVILDSIRKKGITNVLSIFLGTFTQDGALAHLWFFWALIIIYIILPILYKFKIFDNKNKFRNVIILILSISVIIDIIFNYMYVKYNTNILENIPQCFRIWIWFLYFFMGGYYSRYIQNNITIKKNIIITAILTIISFVYQYQLFVKTSFTINSEYIYGNLIIILWVISIFNLLNSIKIEGYRFKRIIEYLSNYIMGIYILHPMIINILNLSYHEKGPLYAIVMWICAIVISLVCSIIISKIPKVKQFIRI